MALVTPWVFEKTLGTLPGLDSLDPRLGLRYKHTYGVLSAFLIYVTMVCEGRWTHWIMSSLPLRAMGVVCFSLLLGILL